MEKNCVSVVLTSPEKQGRMRIKGLLPTPYKRKKDSAKKDAEKRNNYRQECRNKRKQIHTQQTCKEVSQTESKKEYTRVSVT